MMIPTRKDLSGPEKVCLHWSGRWRVQEVRFSLVVPQLLERAKRSRPSNNCDHHVRSQRFYESPFKSRSNLDICLYSEPSPRPTTNLPPTLTPNIGSRLRSPSSPSLSDPGATDGDPYVFPAKATVPTRPTPSKPITVGSSPGSGRCVGSNGSARPE
jgi:hypothetical protein